MSGNTSDPEDVPSRKLDLLRSLEGAKVASLVRYSWWPAEEAARELAIPRSSVFSLTGGPLLVKLDSGTVIGAASQPSTASVTIWLERDQEGNDRSGFGINEDDELTAIDAGDPVYSDESIRTLPGRRVISVHIVKRRPPNTLWQGLPCEVGILLAFESAGELLLSHGLHNSSDDFSVITRSQIDPSLKGELFEVGLTDLE
jgi:hypothetical protein